MKGEPSDRTEVAKRRASKNGSKGEKIDNVWTRGPRKGKGKGKILNKKF